MDYKDFKLDQFEFKDQVERNLSKKVSDFLRRVVGAPSGTGGSPVKFKEKTNESRQEPILEDLCRGIGFNGSDLENIVRIHKQRLKSYLKARKVIYFLFSVPVSQILMFGLVWLFETVRPLSRSISTEGAPYSRVLMMILEVLILYCIVLLFFLVVVGAANKIGSVLTDKRFADTLCACASVYLVIELSRENVLTHPERKKTVAKRISVLARNTSLLPFRYLSKNEFNQLWIKEHFRHLEQYIRVRERWVIAPLETTLSDLRSDFYNLASICITGDYGRFDWTSVDSVIEVLPASLRKRFFVALPRYLGIALPLTLMGFLIWKRAYLESLGMGINILALIFIAWLLLAVDAALKLGIVANVVGLAKEIKNLK